MADHSKPTLTSTYSNFLSEVDGRIDDLAVGLDPAVTTATNVPTGAIRWNSASSKWEKWSGTAWADLAASYNINLAGPLTLTANSSSDALRITQAGAGNALVVEDSTSPDSTPVVIDTIGNLIVGSQTVNLPVSGGAALQTNGTGNGGATIAAFQWSSSTNPSNALGGQLALVRSKSGAIGTNTPVASGDTIGSIFMEGADGSRFVRAAAIQAYVDGDPSDNDIPGRLVFSTTADGASSPTERMRIDSAGRVGFSITPTANAGIIRFGNSVTGSATTRGIVNDMTVQSDVTTFRSFVSQANTAAASFTLGSLSHFIADPITFGSGSTVTTQYGFHAASSLTGAVTNNYGFYGNIPSGTGRWNFYAAGTAANLFNGSLDVGVSLTGAAALSVHRNSVSGNQIGIYNNNVISGYIGANSSNCLLVGNTSGTTIFAVSSSGGVSIERTAVTAPAASDGNVFSGTYTPTLTNGTNVTNSTANALQYMRVGSVVTVLGRITGIATTASGNSAISISLPIASNLGSSGDVGGGGGFSSTTLRGTAAWLYSDATNDNAVLNFSASAASTSQTVHFSFTYRII